MDFPLFSLDWETLPQSGDKQLNDTESKNKIHLMLGTVQKVDHVKFQDLSTDSLTQFPILKWAKNNNMVFDDENMCFIEIAEFSGDSSKGQFLLFSEDKYKDSPFKEGDKLRLRYHPYFGWMPLIKTDTVEEQLPQSSKVPYKQYKDLTVIDIETSNEEGKFISKAADIIEIAVVHVTPDFKTSVLLDTVVQPKNWKQLETSWMIAKGFISLKELKSALASERVAERLQKIITEHKHWTAFNTRFESNYLQRDPWNISKRPFKDIAKATNDYFNTDTPESVFGPSYLNKQFVFYHLTDFSHQEMHRALDCVYMEVEILRHLVNLEMYEFPYDWIL